MSLVFDIAWTHVRARVRQTGFAVAGVASTPTTPLRVAAAAGFTAGSIPTIGTVGNVCRSVATA